MLFSREDVSAFLNENFEPAWEMVRPVPVIRIDFGSGRISTRTLHGNVASYVCGADGNIIDTLPGIYTPDVYMTALTSPRDVAVELRRATAAAKLDRLRVFHRTCAENLQRLVAAPRERDVGKVAIERVVEVNVVRAEANQSPVPPQARPRTAAELASWQPLVEDTRINETQGRLAIHRHLAASELVQPEQIKRWLYREVLRADLDDPHMGLGADFFDGIEGS